MGSRRRLTKTPGSFSVSSQARGTARAHGFQPPRRIFVYPDDRLKIWGCEWLDPWHGKQIQVGIESGRGSNSPRIIAGYEPRRRCEAPRTGMKIYVSIFRALYDRTSPYPHPANQPRPWCRPPSWRQSSTAWLRQKENKTDIRPADSIPFVQWVCETPVCALPLFEVPLDGLSCVVPMSFVFLFESPNPRGCTTWSRSRKQRMSGQNPGNPWWTSKIGSTWVFIRPKMEKCIGYDPWPYVCKLWSMSKGCKKYWTPEQRTCILAFACFICPIDWWARVIKSADHMASQNQALGGASQNLPNSRVQVRRI